MTRSTSKYRSLAREFIMNNPLCQAKIYSGCTGMATECHHVKGRTESLLTDTSNFLAVCHNCHHYIHNVNPKLAKEKGYLKDDFKPFMSELDKVRAGFYNEEID